MSETEMTTLARIHAAAKEEFLQKGFQKASLRNIGRDDRRVLRLLREQGGAL